MVEMAQLISKVLVLDDAADCHLRIKEFCDGNHLLGLRAQPDNVMAILKSNVDLGGVFLSEDYGRQAGDGLRFAAEIRRVRPELPIFLRRSAPTLEEASDSDGGLFYQAYSIENIDKLGAVISSCIFSQVYPNALVRGITEITKLALESQFKEVEVSTEPPYIVRDRIIYGELFTLIPLESNWCRGYMMLQTEEQPLKRFVECAKTHVVADAPTFRDINQVLGEVTNLAWGGFKNRFIAYEELTGRLSQVPIVVNHLNRYISFGSEDPQLCFKYTLTDTRGEIPPLVLFQRFVFNMNWSPDNFKENDTRVDDLFESGELELF
jgi:hypothetical protein